jgi:16S rRNA (cytosine967-C5)-methyltransferase
VTPARQAAYDILMTACRGSSIDPALESHRAQLSPPDAALATELAYGVLRRRAQLDFLIILSSGKPKLPTDAEVLTALRLGAYQLRFLTRIPAHAAVSESVELVKRHGKRSAAGLVNALLRKLPPLPEPWPDAPTRLSIPDWILARWTGAWGREAAESAALAALQPPETYIRHSSSSDQTQTLEETEVPGCYRVSGPVPPACRIQDIGSQWVASLLEVHPGHAVLDLCAAPGNKTAQLLEASPRIAVACDASPRRLKAMALSGHAAGARLLRLDATQPLPFGPIFDRILVDAPCSGTGTLARNPDIKWRLAPDDILRHAARQKQILASALACLKPGGRLVYSTCSIEPEENSEVLAHAASGYSIQSFTRLPGRDPGDGFQAAVIT